MRMHAVNVSLYSLALKEVGPMLAQTLAKRTPGPGLSHLEGEN